MGWDIAFWVIVAALIYVLVRPGSPAGVAVVAVTDLAAGLIGAATGSLFISSPITKGAGG